MAKCRLNSPRPTDVYMRPKTMPSLVQIGVPRQFDAKPSSQPMLSYCRLNLDATGLIHENGFEDVVSGMAAGSYIDIALYLLMDWSVYTLLYIHFTARILSSVLYQK